MTYEELLWTEGRLWEEKQILFAKGYNYRQVPCFNEWVKAAWEVRNIHLLPDPPTS